MEFADVARLASGHVEARIVQAAVELGIFDALWGGSINSGTLATTLGLEPRATELLLNALAALKLLEKDSGTFSLATISENYLVRQSPQYLGGMILFDASLWRCWEQLGDAVRTGKAVRPPNMYQENPKETATFINAMDSLVKARGDAEILAGVFHWEGVKNVLDIGSGPATYPIALCRRFPELRATIFDLPGTLKVTERYVRDAQMEKQIRLVAGDYRSEAIPGNYDVVFLSNIIHGESDDENGRLIAKLYSALVPGGKIIIKDHILDETRAEPAVGAIFSLLMLLTTESGRCYSFNEIKAWLERAGFSQIEKNDLPAPLTSSLVIGTR